MPLRELQLNFIEGRPIAAYLSLHPEPRRPISRTEERDRGLIVDFAEGNVVVGVEILEFGGDVPERLNRLMKKLGLETLSAQELRPLRVA